MASRARRDADNVAESLRRHGFTPEGVETVLAMEDKIATRKRAPKLPESPLDFGDWQA
ncbi:hypothetical protein SEA_CECE_341 [Microbacterium phage Cece]|nr:hypothetical protein SEA_CECE_39 [Microbacterium phage Cece]UVG35347.1 hypothetical protein SEA_CECE_341 [Microbacterium phage Cece]